VKPVGKSFHIHAPVTGKARRPTVESLTAGTDRLSVVQDRSLCRSGMSAVRVICRRVQRSVGMQRPVKAKTHYTRFSVASLTSWQLLGLQESYGETCLMDLGNKSARRP